MDGTFRVVPTIFSQLYIIHGFFRGEKVPFAYFLLPNKSKETYMRMFEPLKNYAISIGRNFEPPTFHLDYEISTLRAIRESFPNSEVKGYLFHFNQCLWREVQGSGLVTFYRECGVKRIIRSTAALALVPLNRIEDAWLDTNADSSSSEHPAHAKLEDFKLYFINTWMENETVFPRRMWNHYHNFGARSTNHLEGWHTALNRIIEKSHVNLYEVIKRLQGQEEKFRLDMTRSRMR
ncbi:uncharacterized protein LOC108864344 [Galendromus occidentalis]|uniref:Uncharacterized protein LOC108864344 n=1 Tax=Galendromus occidentalis TaxID=34638 RepID=A0AAJ7L6D1_9ACAR|nr:uncharacterized protein LOC108864344 [Galendromus occidentalis]